ncbi:formate dehydrogenase accessory sulfurtransferase FdhD [Romboutsia sp.]|uniref:formate dehydrogenase accessory sulfurtransferase FdhD n=1 Tax=Romboutsia sp. TaxID=1965302 RepID=UPI002B7A4546|nr:formate dehydrogenase accessory sulfurtransferase FdhD [Romboutsia sp.]HSQ87577.1 formate dehydrogenase accessory sulfurtransferase FdhD [Romboutsia sp.]
MNSIKKYRIKRYEKDSLESTVDSVIVEYLFTIFIDSEEFITLMCTPKSLKELAIGFLHSESIIESISDIKSITVFEEKGYVNIELNNRDLLNEKTNKKRVITSGCGKGSMYYNELDRLTLNTNSSNREREYSWISKVMNEFNKMSKLFLETGGVHSVALSDFDKIIFFEEDIGRHNALDKVIGKCLEDNIDIKDKVILTSGRITSEIVLKCAKLNINYIISRSAATNVAIDLSNVMNIRLIGFARGKRMNIYSD